MATKIHKGSLCFFKWEKKKKPQLWLCRVARARGKLRLAGCDGVNSGVMLSGKCSVAASEGAKHLFPVSQSVVGLIQSDLCDGDKAGPGRLAGGCRLSIPMNCTINSQQSAASTGSCVSRGERTGKQSSAMQCKADAHGRGGC